jgi:hypothetical protein
MRRLIAALLLLTVALPAAAQDATCPPTPPRLTVGDSGRVMGGITVNVRQQPRLGDNHAGRMPPYSLFTVLEGPVCADGYRWWRVSNHHAADSVSGWAAEGSADGETWLEPRGPRVEIDGRAYVVGADGVPEAEGCLEPPDDYTRVQDGWAVFNQRTRFMLDQAQRLYAAQTGQRYARFIITQGSYNPGAVSASFGTHDGGGAVDISVRDPQTWAVLTDELDDMIYALRAAGFAAWVRAEGSLYTESPIHIHAVAVGDRELSPAAWAQVYGPGGYLAGYDGLPADYGGPHADPHGGPVICRWMDSGG